MDNKEIKILNIDTTLYHTRLSKKFENRKPFKPADPNIVESYIPGTILDILVRVGQIVEPGDELLVLDAMKMQNRLKAPVKGTVKKILVKSGDKVSKGTVMVELG
jgi:biotin carboxyl carrier protein